MSSKCLDLVVATGTKLFVSALGNDRCPEPAVFTITDTVIPGDTDISVSPLLQELFQGEEIKFYTNEPFQKVLVGKAQVASYVPKGATIVPVDSLDFIMLSGDEGVSIGLHEVIGVESVSSQLSNQVNAVTLLNSDGWVNKSPGISEWNFQATGYIPKDFIDLKGYSVIKSAAINRKFLYVERHLENGEVKAGVVMVSSLSDQVQGAGYVQYSATFDGAEENVWEFIEARKSTTPNPTTTTTSRPPTTTTTTSPGQPTTTTTTASQTFNRVFVFTSSNTGALQGGSPNNTGCTANAQISPNTQFRFTELASRIGTPANMTVFINGVAFLSFNYPNDYEGKPFVLVGADGTVFPSRAITAGRVDL